MRSGALPMTNNFLKNWRCLTKGHVSCIFPWMCRQNAHFRNTQIALSFNLDRQANLPFLIHKNQIVEKLLSRDSHTNTVICTKFVDFEVTTPETKIVVRVTSLEKKKKKMDKITFKPVRTQGQWSKGNRLYFALFAVCSFSAARITVIWTTAISLNQRIIRLKFHM